MRYMLVRNIVYGVGVWEEELIACVHSYCGASFCSMLEDYKIKLVFAGKVCVEL